ncbi:putative alginate O-acetylase AlgI [Rhodovastum atsumiense]|uniref:Probable alginate O-acetylase AlgI n=1 Tax=Rhodovastum atsumiense TaxID=504468 RepID=A0A5M6IM46_9PROT|nr:MBOAT family protein [Rhodovastum atsumiense]KAA5609320.1 MBOAT family protein [Rhodovastum atsumiense]CAH2602383.1 putative alginate O-acetylase AlgI [Rhodovastum atsumiense]
MIFASFEFLLLFLPAFFATYFLAPARLRNLVIVAFSWAFYAWWRVDFLALLAGVTLGTFLVARAMDRAGPASRRGRVLLLAGLAGNLGVLGYFKYANFGVATFNDLVTAWGGQPMAWTQIVLPVGLSFYVLQSISYLVDLRRGSVPVSRSFLDYAAYKALFPQLIAGPIVRYAEIADALKHRTHSLRLFGEGARIAMTGFAMKVVFGDTLSPVVDAAFALPAPSLADAWTGALAYTLQLYFDFAGYSLLAIGLARMMGFHFPANFDNPYLATSIQEFWQRWHMTLSRFLRDYLYVPLGGNRHGPVRTYLNLMAVMVIGGAWHGASWNFIVWGAWQGLCLGLHRAWSRRRPRHAPASPMHRLGAHLLTMLAVVLGWVVFRAADLGAAGTLYAGMLGLHGIGLSDALAWQITPDRHGMLLLALLAVYAPLLRGLVPRPALPLPGWLGGGMRVAGPLAAFSLGIVLLYSRDAVPFLYFQF